MTDNKGATATITKSTTVQNPVAGLLIDEFARTVNNGFGNADRGGAWNLSGAATNYSVDAGLGKVTASAGQGRTLTLPAVQRSDLETQLVFSYDKSATGGGTYMTIQGRRIDAQNNYATKTRVMPSGDLQVLLTRTVAGTETTLSSQIVPSLKVAAGEQLVARTQVTGTSPTTIRAKVWKKGAPEPSSWNLTTTDGAASLQANGMLGVYYYLSGSTSNGPITLRLDELWGGPPRP